jgi:hypothetical protein
MVALDNLGTADERRREFNEMARILNTAEFDMTCRRMTDHAGCYCLTMPLRMQSMRSRWI